MEQLATHIKELKKNKFDVESIVAKATTLPFPQEDQLFSATTALQRNVVFLGNDLLLIDPLSHSGKSGVGKTTCFEVLKDASYCTPRGHSLLGTIYLLLFVPFPILICSLRCQ